MADVRLTATNPEDSSVVPVACDAAGRLLLEEPQVIEGPPGPPGEQGPPGQDGDPFSGNFAGDVTFGGSAAFAGGVDVDSMSTKSDATSAAAWITRWNSGNGNVANVYADGSCTFAGNVDVGNWPTFGSRRTQSGAILANRSDAETSEVWSGGFSGNATSRINANGSAKFAGGKAGFTPEGYLWCTTRRGDTVILDATSNGLASWVEYTPTSRIDDLRDKLDANRGDTGEMPADTP